MSSNLLHCMHALHACIALWSSIRLTCIAVHEQDKRVEALRSIIAFIGFPEVSDERLRCAFALADSKHAKVGRAAV